MYCYFHGRKATVRRFLGKLYENMKQRVDGKYADQMNRGHIYVGKPIASKDEFLEWSKNDHDFLALYKQWVMCGFDRKMTPSIDRINSKLGYTLGNMRWMTNSQNCGLAGVAKGLNAKKAIYELLGIGQNGEKNEKK